MIKQGAQLSIQRIPLSKILATKVDVRFPDTLNGYIQCLIDHPECDLEPIHVQPHCEYAGLHTLENGYHRFLAYIMAGRSEAVCFVEEIEESGTRVFTDDGMGGVTEVSV